MLIALALSLPSSAAPLSWDFDDNSFDVATVGFGVRNLEDLDGGFREACRVLRPGGRFQILEFSRPPNPVFRADRGAPRRIPPMPS